MKIGGLQKFSLLDYPGKIAAVLFTRGCNFRCGYCHNPELVLPKQYASLIPLKSVYEFLEKRKKQLEAVCVTGGEPTQHLDLVEVLEQIKSMGYAIKLDTNGTRPDMLQTIIERQCVDYFAMDIKAPFEKYEYVVRRQISKALLEKSIAKIMQSKIPYEFRVTIVKSLTSREDLVAIAKAVRGAKKLYLQRFVPSKLNDPAFSTESSYSEEELLRIAEKLRKYVDFCGVR